MENIDTETSVGTRRYESKHQPLAANIDIAVYMAVVAIYQYGRE